MGLVERVGLDGVEGGEGVYEPVRHEGTGVDEEERMYSAELVGWETAVEKLGGGVMADVVRRGWERVERRMEMEGGDG